MDETIKKAKRDKLIALNQKYYEAMKGDGLLLSERDVIEQFVRPLLGDILGFPIDDPTRYRTEVHTATGRPDIVIYPDNGQTLYIEAKRFGRISKLPITRNQLSAIKPHQLLLPSMAKDRTYEEQQAINYAFNNGGKWAILTNFETFRLFNARRDWLVLSFDGPDTYIQDFDFLMKLSYENILNGGLDELDGTRYRLDVDEDYLSFINEWREKLGQDLLQNRAKNEWLYATGTPDAKLLREVVQRFIDRLVVIRFAEDHFVISPPVLEGIYNLGQNNIYVVLQNILHDFFKEFDKLHNSALFATHATDQAHFTQKTILSFLGFLNDARYRAMPADILGNTYEQYLGKRLNIEAGEVFTRDNLETRKKQGSYYTPQPMVQFLVDRTLGRYLYATDDGTPNGSPLPDQTRKTSADIADLTVIDCASGSGSFLIYAYQVLATFYQSEIARLTAEYTRQPIELHKKGMSKLDIQLELVPITAELERITNHYPRIILEKHLYGVDLDPQAAEVAVVNLMMRALEGGKNQTTDKRLPLLLNQNVKVGNGLVGALPSDISAEHAPQIAKLIALRAELLHLGYGARHDEVVTEIETLTNTLREAYNSTFKPHFTDLSRTNPFHWGIEFPEVFFNADGTPKADGGFSFIIGNPPWEIVKPDLREFYAQYDPKIEHGYKRAQAEAIIQKLNEEHPDYVTEYTASTTNIEQTAGYIRQSAHFSQQGKGDSATHKMFVERAWRLLQPDGFLGYVVPSGIYSDLGTKQLRQMLFDGGRVLVMAGLSNERAIFPSIHRSFKFTLLAVQKGGRTTSFPVTFRIGYDDYPPLKADFDRDDVLRAVLYDKNAYFEMSIPTIQRFSPDSLSVMEFKSPAMYRLADKFYGTHALLGDKVDGAWAIKFTREFDMTNDRHLFLNNPTNADGIAHLPLYEGKMIHQFDAFYAQPQYWVDEKRGAERVKNKPNVFYNQYRLAWREVTGSTNERTLISTVLPPNNFAGHTLWTGYTENPKILLFYVAVFNSYCMDWLARMKAGTHITLFLLKSLPMPRIDDNHPLFAPIVRLSAQLVCVRPEFDALWASLGDVVADSTPAISADHRAGVRRELDGYVAHLYGIEHHEYLELLKAFPLVFPNNKEGDKAREAYASGYVDVKNRLKG
ncbi:MAG: DNA methyltransferase [bacterium]|nr:DNA methyltransferase [bacterium]